MRGVYFNVHWLANMPRVEYLPGDIHLRAAVANDRTSCELRRANHLRCGDILRRIGLVFGQSELRWRIHLPGHSFLRQQHIMRWLAELFGHAVLRVFVPE